VLEIAVRCLLNETSAVEADRQLRNNGGTTMVHSHEDLAEKFQELPFNFRPSSEEFYYLRTVLAKKMSEFGSMNRLYHYIRQKIKQYEHLTPSHIQEYLAELSCLMNKTQVKNLKEMMNAKSEVKDDTWEVYDTLMSFTIIEPKILKKHKFAFIYNIISQSETKITTSNHVYQTSLITGTNNQTSN
jgi:hypothetical protein